MGGTLQPILLLVISATLLAVPAHLLLRRLFIASLIAGSAASVTLQLPGLLQGAFRDEFFELSLLVGAFWGTVVAIGVGQLLRRALPAGPRKGWVWRP